VARRQARDYARRTVDTTNLAVEGQVSATAQNQALGALVFLYRTVLGGDVGNLEWVIRVMCSAPCVQPCRQRGSANRQPATHSAIRLPRTFWNRKPTSVRFRNYSAIAM
jgi:hypothetical protein